MSFIFFFRYYLIQCIIRKITIKILPLEKKYLFISVVKHPVRMMMLLTLGYEAYEDGLKEIKWKLHKKRFTHLGRQMLQAPK